MLIKAAAPLDLPVEWVASLTPEARGSEAHRIADLPVPFRAALIRTLSPTDQANIWKRTIDNYIAAHPELTADHRRLLGRAAGMATASLFERGDATPELLKVAAEIEGALGRGAKRELFITAGPEPPTIDAPRLPLRLSIRALARSLYVVAADPVECNCYTLQTSDCPIEMYCSEAQGCEFSHFGCGIWNMESCNGYCVPHPE